MNRKIEPLAALLADGALIAAGLVHLYLTAVLVKARLRGQTPPEGAP
jgi:hypothetical protein